MKQRLQKLTTGQLLVLSVILSAIISSVLIILFGLWLQDELCNNTLLIGLAGIASVSLIIILMLRTIVQAVQRIHRQQAERTLYLDSLLYSTGKTLIIGLDSHLQIRYLNALAERALGMSSNAAQNQALEPLFRPLQEGLLQEALAHIAGGRDFSFTFSLDIDNSPRYFEATLGHLHYRDESSGYQLIAHDTTDRKQLEDTLRTFSYQDGLTGIANRRRFDEALKHEWRRAAREQQSLSLIMIDIDFFKNYNDHYGHPAGDECLKALAHTLSQTVSRPGDLLARYGGEEFAVILPNTPLPGATRFAEKIRTSIESLQLPHARSSIGPWVTVSLGLASHRPLNGEDPTLLVKRADQALYRAKQQGRNRVEMDDSCQSG